MSKDPETCDRCPFDLPEPGRLRQKLRIVTEPWAPYVYEHHGATQGLDYETTVIVFQRLGVDVQWQFLLR